MNKILHILLVFLFSLYLPACSNNGGGGGPFSKLDRLVQLEPEVRLDLINKFKEFIKSGEYKIDPDEVASKMISDALEEDLA